MSHPAVGNECFCHLVAVANGQVFFFFFSLMACTNVDNKRLLKNLSNTQKDELPLHIRLLFNILWVNLHITMTRNGVTAGRTPKATKFAYLHLHWRTKSWLPFKVHVMCSVADH